MSSQSALILGGALIVAVVLWSSLARRETEEQARRESERSIGATARDQRGAWGRLFSAIGEGIEAVTELAQFGQPPQRR